MGHYDCGLKYFKPTGLVEKGIEFSERRVTFCARRTLDMPRGSLLLAGVLKDVQADQPVSRLRHQFPSMKRSWPLVMFTAKLVLPKRWRRRF